MSVTTQYQRLLRQLRTELPDLEKRVLKAITAHPEGISRHDLVRAVHGVEPKVNINLDQNDRRNRKAIQRLRNRFVPIIANSARSGYRINPTKQAVEEMIAEWESRISKISRNVKAARRFYKIQAKQMDMPFKGKKV